MRSTGSKAMSQAAITNYKTMIDEYAESVYATTRNESPDTTGNDLSEYETPWEPGDPNRLPMWVSQERYTELREAKRSRDAEEAPKKKKKKVAKKRATAFAVTEPDVFAIGPRAAALAEAGRKFDKRIGRFGTSTGELHRAHFVGSDEE